jgi:hypothetical protein
MVTKFTGTGEQFAVSSVAKGLGLKAARDLTVTTDPSEGDTVTIDGRVYTFWTSLTGHAADDGAVLIDTGASADSLLAALTLDPGGSGTLYSAGTTAHSTVDATVTTNVITIRAKAYGRVGNSIAIAKSGTNLAWQGGAETLLGGEDPGVIFSVIPETFVTGLGPFSLTGTDASYGLDLDLLYYLRVVDADNIMFALSAAQARDGDCLTYPAEATGDFIIQLGATTNVAIYETMRRGIAAERLGVATDIDAL